MKAETSQYAGTMDAETLTRFKASPQARESMDDEIRRLFKVPQSRYFTVTLTNGNAGKVFIDRSRTRVVVTPKLSKSAA